jgi:hypothetical protein
MNMLKEASLKYNKDLPLSILFGKRYRRAIITGTLLITFS